MRTSMRNPAAALLAGALLASAGVAGHADQKSDRLFARAREVAGRIRSLEGAITASYSVTGTTQKMTGTVKVLKPGFWELDAATPDGQHRQQLVSDGKSITQVMEAEKQYAKMGPAGPAILVGFAPPAASLLITPEGLPKGGKSRYTGKVTRSGRTYEVVQVIGAPGLPAGATIRYFFGPSGLPEGRELRYREEGATMLQSAWIHGLRLNTPLAEKQFAYRPPADFKLYEEPDLNASLLPEGKDAPDFLLPQPGGGTQLALSEARKGKKAVLVNFWFYG